MQYPLHLYVDPVMPYRLLPVLAVLLTAPLAWAHPHHADDDADHPPVHIAPSDEDTDAADSDHPPFYLAQQLQNQVRITERGGQRVVTSNGIPNHPHGEFPNRGNPHTITAQNHRYTMPLDPQPADRPTDARGWEFGVALSGVPFDPGTAEYYDADGRRQRSHTRNGWNYEALSGQINLGTDIANAHVQPSGKYHYHGLPVPLLQQLATPGQPTLLGYAADGYPIYGPRGYRDPEDPDSGLVELSSSYRVRDGRRPAGNDSPGGRYDGTFVADYEFVEGSGDLDRFNGRTGVTPEYPDGTFHYVLTTDYPFVPRLFHGSPDRSFQHRRGGNAGQDRGDRPQRPDRPRRPGPPRDR
jgi:hypothetical protein